MRYRSLGRSGLKVSEVCLGTMTFGHGTDEAEAQRMVDRAIDTGINFFDTANSYADAQSEVFLGKALKGKRKDVVVATNLHADILSDLAAALSGSLGIAPTANLNPEREFPSMFEPIHGAGFDIAGQGIANPVAAFWSAVLMLDHLGEAAAAAGLLGAIERALASGRAFTPDLGGSATTAQVTEAVCAALKGANL